MKEMSCLVIGNGLIGDATAYMLRTLGHSVKTYDRAPDRSDYTAQELEEVLPRFDYVFSVVNTNPRGTGLDLSLLDDTVSKFAKYANPLAVFVQRCTTLPGSARMLAARYGILDQYVMMPSFAYRKTARYNEANPEKVVIGAAEYALVRKTMLELFPSDSPMPMDREKVFLGTLEEAEMSKVASNLFQAAIIGIWNELKENTQGLDSGFVMETVIQEHSLASIKRFHGKAWGKGGRLDDDLRGWTWRFGDYSPIMKALYQSNERLREKVGEENRPGSELAKLAFTGRVSPNLMKDKT